MDSLTALYLIQSLAVLWHAIAFGAGGVFVYFSYRALFELEPYALRWGKIIRHADVHLWLSGLAIIAISTGLVGAEKYFSNPKLWTKITVIIIWALSTQILRHVALPLFKEGKRNLMLSACSVNMACWLYGAFLGCAKGLAYGRVSYPLLEGGFILTIGLCYGLTRHYEKRYQERITS